MKKVFKGREETYLVYIHSIKSLNESLRPSALPRILLPGKTGLESVS